MLEGVNRAHLFAKVGQLVSYAFLKHSKEVLIQYMATLYSVRFCTHAVCDTFCLHVLSVRNSLNRMHYPPAASMLVLCVSVRHFACFLSVVAVCMSISLSNCSKKQVYNHDAVPVRDQTIFSL